MPNHPLTTIAEAAASAMRVPFAATRMRGPTHELFVALAYDQGWALGDRRLRQSPNCVSNGIRRSVTSPWRGPDDQLGLEAPQRSPAGSRR
jgi:hypothetical protein